jgi:nucleotide-binding universal stress UspA family protein
MAIRRVLIAIDGSPAAREACRVGLEIAAASGAQATLLHASRAIADSLFADQSPEPPSAADITAADEVLRDACRLAGEQGVEASLDVSGDEDTESLIPTIVGAAEALDADLIVMGSRGRGQVAGALLGSASPGVLTATKRPVLVVHDPAGA